MKATQEQINCNDLGQIRPGSNFGDVLTEMARKSETIVEIGTWRGLGSTYCLYLGMERSTQRLFTVESNVTLFREASSYYDDPRVTVIYGTLCPSDKFAQFEHPNDESRQFYLGEMEHNKTAPYVLDKIPEDIDLLMIDSGEWSARGEFLSLWKRSKVIAMDDTNSAKVQKNIANRQNLIDAGWIIVKEILDDRNGWSVFQRP